MTRTCFIDGFTSLENTLDIHPKVALGITLKGLSELHLFIDNIEVGDGIEVFV